jgi:HlyD family secretion protein
MSPTMRPFATIIAPVLAVALAIAAPSSAEKAAAAAPESTNLPAVSVAYAAPASLVARVRASGMIGPVEEVLVQPQIEGQAIETIEAEVGDWVEKGAVLARLSVTALGLQRSQLDAQRASAEASIAQSEALVVEAEALRDEALRERDRVVRLEEQGVASSAAGDTARSSAATALARVASATQALNASRAQLRLVDAQIDDIELQLERTAVVAPVAGRVTKRTANIGSIATMAGEPLFAIVRDGALELRADVAEQDVLALAPGQAAELRVVGLTEPIDGVIRLVEPTVDPTSRLGRVRIGIEEPDRVRPGMFAEAEIRVRASEGIAVPASAVSGSGRDASVLRVGRDGLVAATPIVPGIRDRGLVEVVEGLAAGDAVVAKAGAFVRDGDRINPVPADAAAGVSN